MNRVILHSDLNAFYASVECLYNPDIRNKPVAVTGDIEKRHGIILAKNQHAKNFGIKTGEAVWEAKVKCPDVVFVPARFERYIKFSRLVRDIYADYTDQIESFGLDECWLDITQSKQYGNGKEVADIIRQRIKDELGVSASVGVSFNKIFAKLGSDYKKPDATTLITPDNYKDVVWPLPAEDLLYVGRKTKIKLNEMGIKTIGDIACADIERLRRRFGVNGYTLWIFANGYDSSAVCHQYSDSYIKSIGNSTTTPRDLLNDDDVKVTLYVLCESVAERLRDHKFRCLTVQITIRDSNLGYLQRQCTLPYPTCVSSLIFDYAFALYKRNHMTGKPIRSIGVRASNLVSDYATQLSFLPERVREAIQEETERTIDYIRSRFGHHSIQRATMLTDRELSALSPKEEHTIHPVSYFRGIL